MSQKILFATLSSSAEKIRFLIKVAQDHFNKNQKLIIFTSDLKTAEFVDHLLWSEPKDGFLPHFITQTFIDECIVITSEKSNLNSAKAAFNLGLEPLNPQTLNLSHIFEIEDQSSPEKGAIFKKKLTFYQKSRLPIVSIN
ncbi:MAG: hypothetical protein EBU93_01255 [Chlamydiae bacterium]|jgi:DNA polymerase-3 subunit chi|nr:hypothetical protein [Chlamydiota bacterium]